MIAPNQPLLRYISLTQSILLAVSGLLTVPCLIILLFSDSESMTDFFRFGISTTLLLGLFSIFCGSIGLYMVITSLINSDEHPENKFSIRVSTAFQGFLFLASIIVLMFLIIFTQLITYL